jgi:hypothetical protein
VSRQDGNAQSTQNAFATTHHPAQSEVFKRACSTYVPQADSIKDAQTDLRLFIPQTPRQRWNMTSSCFLRAYVPLSSHLLIC